MQFIKDRIHSMFPQGMIDAINKKGGFFISGGFMTSMVTRRDINDVDIYFVNAASLTEFIRYMQDDTAWCTFISEKTINYSYDGWPLQLIYYDYYETLQDIWNDYDFTINCCGWDSRSDEVEMHEKFLLHNSQRYIEFNPNTKFPIISALRIAKMKDRGYYIPRNQFVKIMLAVNNLEINSWEEFKSACGNLYGLNYISDEIIKDSEFSIENALDVIENTKFEGKGTVSDYKIDPRIVDVVVSGEKIKYVEFKDSIQVIYPDHEHQDMLGNLIKDGGIPAERVDVKEWLGEYVYKWVGKGSDGSLYSHYDRSFKYTLGEEVVARKDGFGFSKGSLWFRRYKDLGRATYNNQGVVIKCKYNPEDIVNISNKDITITKCVPIEEVEWNKDDFKLSDVVW